MIFNLLKSDFYRLAHGKALWVTLIVLAAITAFLVWAFQSIAAAGSSVDPSAFLTIDLTESVEELTASPSHMYGVIFVSLLYINTLGGVLVTLDLSADSDSGFVKNLWPTGTGKKTYLAGKLALCMVLAFLMLLVCIIVATATCFALGMPLRMTESSEEFLLWLLLYWLTTTGYLMVTATVALIIRNKAVSLTVALLLGLDIIESLLGALFGLFESSGTVIPHVYDWLLAHDIELLRVGAVGIGVNAAHIAVSVLIIITLCVVLTMTVGVRRIF